MDMLACPFDCYKGQSTFPLFGRYRGNYENPTFFLDNR